MRQRKGTTNGTRRLGIGLAFWIALSATGAGHAAPAPRPAVDCIRPLVGTRGEGNTYPGAVAPFGMIQLSPDTDDHLWETASGYEYADSAIIAFSLTHLSGTGIPDLGDIRFMPTLGTPRFVAGTKAHPDSGYAARYDHATETAEAGYYAVRLARSGVRVELSAGERAGLFRLTYPAADSAGLLVDLARVLRWDVAWSNLRVVDDSTLTGFHLVNGWAKERYTYFAARFSRPLDDYTIMKDGQPVLYNGYRFRSRAEATGRNLQFHARWATRADERILVKVAISAVSTANALENLAAEIPGWDFDGLRRATRARWAEEMARIDIEGTPAERETFYTSLYHACLAPQLFQDVNGQYRGLDQNTHTARGFTNHAVFSLWDTYRAEHPLFTLIQAGRDADMINSMLAHYDQSVEHLLPVWSLQGNETWCMIGYHALPVIADAWRRGVRGFDPRRAYAAMRATALNPHYDNVATYARLGWVPFDRENESVSKTLEYAYDDFTLARMAEALGETADAAEFDRRSLLYRNLFDPGSGLMRGRDGAGRWRTPFDPHLYVEGGDITEGTSWQYSWYVPHDVPGLIALMGGRERFARRLDSLFVAAASDSTRGVDDIQGRIGEYWHGNEPSHHIAYLYDDAGEPWQTQKWVTEIRRTQYGNQPGALCGNDDCGQMSAWYIFSTLGFYPVCPAGDTYRIGSPGTPRAVLHLSNGHTFTMTARGLSERNFYIQSARLNGADWPHAWLPCSAVLDGGTLEFEMGPRPNRRWGVDATLPR